MLPLIQSSYFQNLINGFPAGVIIFNIDGVAYVANASAQRLLGLEEPQILGRSWEDLFAALEDGPSLTAYLDTARARPPGELEQRAPAQARWQRPDGGQRHLSCTTSHIIEYGKIFGILLAVTDVTHIFEMHARERHMLEAHRALEQERARGLEHFSMAVAHQIRNPVMTIAGFSRLLLRKAEPETSQHEQLSAILDGGLRLNAIVKAVSDYNALHVRELAPVDLTACCRAALEHVRQAQAKAGAEAQADGLHWEVVLPEAACKLQGDAPLLTQAVQELLTNAVEAARLGEALPAVQLCLAMQDEQATLTIADTGPGVAAADFPYLFDPFFTTKPVGVGMGLCKVRRIVREHQGTVLLENRTDGPGARVRVELQTSEA